MGIWVAQGKTPDGGRTVSAGHAAGQSTILIDNADNQFQVGDLVFISAVDYSDVEFLGDILSENDTQIVTRYALAGEKADSAKVWTPEYSVSFEGSRNYTIEDDDGLRVDRTAGGVFRANVVGGPSQVLSFIVPMVTRAKKGEWDTFRAAIGYYQEFTFVNGLREIYSVVLQSSRTTVVRKKLAHYEELPIVLGVIEAGGYE